MSRQRLYIVHGMGNDAVGLVGGITEPIASAGGNIVDLRQDVLHGLFTIYLVVDLTDCEIRIDAFKEIIKSIAEDTGLELSVDNYHPVARNPEKKNILIILVGSDKPGIISSAAQILGNYKANIEFANNIAREGIFLMELLTDVSHCTLPLDNLQNVITQKMNGIGINALFQTENVFNKKKRVILFNIRQNLIPADTYDEIIQQTKLSHKDIDGAYSGLDNKASLNKTAELLEGLSADVIESLAGIINVKDDTIELIQTLKIMGYRICLITNGLSVFVNALAAKLGVKHCYGINLEIDDDSRIVNGEIKPQSAANLSIDNIKNEMIEIEQVSKDDFTMISDEGLNTTPGIHIDLNLEILLDMYNKHVISKDNLIGLLGSFGIQRK